jgi:hypothetical protein
MRQPVRSWYSRRVGITGLVLAAWSWSACVVRTAVLAFGTLVVAAYVALGLALSNRAD